ncbi:uncharacterized protein LOC106180777 isoform X1 [Lingula anatina]|uniref:Uncharacterized protein LOC106180777 isoform X1 n=1 Tax=Lingula anatina TaxID=7574 RepID=A0A1S3KDM2_LINAN|nr:uncharacterized protein LOC106180777 isoform X1 [Lingula anatina]|eukprot:XP_013420356.1 uncharacterized protein LOC106180777 isoform X1 [Lingula anatina]
MSDQPPSYTESEGGQQKPYPTQPAPYNPQYGPPQGQYGPSQGQYVPPPQGQYMPPPQGQYMPPPQGQYMPQPQGQYMPVPQGQYMPPPQGQVIIMNQQQPKPVPPGTRPGWPHDSALRCAAIQIACGILAFILGIVGIAIGAYLASLGTGIWCGIFYIIAGGLGVGAAKKKTTGLLVSHMVLSILSSLACIVLLSFASIGVGGEYSNCLRNHGYYYSYPYEYSNEVYQMCRSIVSGRHIVNSLLIIISVLEGIVAIISSAFTCRGTCCAPKQQQGQVMYTTSPYGQQAITIQYGQPVMTTTGYISPGGQPPPPQPGATQPTATQQV